MPRPLTPKQAAFRDAILAGFPPSEAYKKAYHATGMNKQTIATNAYKLLKHPLLAQAIKEATPISATTATPIVLPAPSQTALYSRERRMEELSYAAFLDPLDVFDEHFHVKPLHDMPERVRRAIASIKVDPVSFITEIKFVDKLSAIASYSKHAGDLPKEPESKTKELPKFDLSKLTDAEFKAYREMRKKVMVSA